MSKSFQSIAQYLCTQTLESKKVIILIPGYYRAEGGMFEYAIASAEDLKRNGFDVTLVLNRSFYNQEVRFDNVVIVPDRLGVGFYQKRLILAAFLPRYFRSFVFKKFYRILADLNPAVIWHTENHFHSSDMLGFYHEACSSAKLLYTVHDPVYHDEKIGIIARLLRLRTDRRVKNYSDLGRVTIHVHKLELLLGSLYSDCKNVISAPHAPIVAFAKRTRPYSISNAEPFRIGFMGRIEKYKGIDDFISICNAVFRRVGHARDIEFEIVGKGIISKKVDSQLDSRLTVVNRYVSDEEFHARMANLDVLVLPYWEATWSGVASMAVSYKVPVIASNVGAISEVVVDEVNGFLVEPRNINEFTNKVLSLIEGSDLYQRIRT